MKKIYLVLGVIIVAAGASHAGILSNILGVNGYNNGYYYPQNVVRYTNGGYYPRPYNNYYYNSSPYYNTTPYGCNHYTPYPGGYYQHPVIYRTKVNRKSSVDSSIKVVANQISGIDKIEKKILLQTYEHDSAKNRIERLEQKIFGASQSGELSDRFAALKSVAKNYKAYNPDAYSSNAYDYAQNNYRPPIFSGSQGSSWKNTALSNFRNQFIGTPTGFTPAMDPAYMDYFEAERSLMGNGESVDVRTNRGYYKSNTNRNTGMGVTILD